MPPWKEYEEGYHVLDCNESFDRETGQDEESLDSMEFINISLCIRLLQKKRKAQKKKSKIGWQQPSVELHLPIIENTWNMHVRLAVRKNMRNWSMELP